jgi:transketolase
MYSDEHIAGLGKRAANLRRHVLSMIGVGLPGHLGGSFSAADVVAALYFSAMKHDPSKPDMPTRDRFILSKGHAAILQYAALAEAGYFPVDELAHAKKIGAMLQGHPDVRTPGVEVNTGSLGQGLSLGLGMALGLRLDESSSRVFVLVGDGELAEGQNWEAIMAAAAHKADNLVAIIDHNKLQAGGPISERFNMGDPGAKFAAFGWAVQECDGHNFSEILAATDRARDAKGRPTAIIAHTVKGKGCSFAEGIPSFHNVPLTREQFDQAWKELEQ